MKTKAFSVVYEDNHLLVVNKAAGILVQGDKTKDKTLTDYCREYIAKKYEKPGAVFLHPIHRLDRPVSGLVAFAQPGKFEQLLDKALETGRWCPQDPVCIERLTDQRVGIHAACHQCLLLPETCCEKFNSWLDRSTIVGRSEKFPTGVL